MSRREEDPVLIASPVKVKQREKENHGNSAPAVPSPIKAHIQARLPEPTLFEKYVKPFLDMDYELGKRIYNAISEFFYVAYSRIPLREDSLSILDTVDYEIRSGKNIRGIDHKVKAACTYNCLDKAITAINAVLSKYTDESEDLSEIRDYLIALNSRLGRELKMISDPMKRQEIKEKTGLDLDKLTSILDKCA